VLPPEVHADPDPRARFEREARAISQLTHPNICTLHDIGRDGETVFLVMEHLDVETLARRLERGPLPLDEALRVGSGIAAALDAGHRHGVVHRDLKPANVMLTRTRARISGRSAASSMRWRLGGGPLMRRAKRAGSARS
jgi:eukaryotic-like serine/threonine-protein kinase